MAMTRADYIDIYTDGGQVPLEDQPTYETGAVIDMEKVEVSEGVFNALRTWGLRTARKDCKQYWKVTFRVEAATLEDYEAFRTRHR